MRLHRARAGRGRRVRASPEGTATRTAAHGLARSRRPPGSGTLPAMPRTIALAACAALLACAAPAGAVVGGEPVAPETVPWFASGKCGGTLVAPDRILTAGH